MHPPVNFKKLHFMSNKIRVLLKQIIVPLWIILLYSSIYYGGYFSIAFCLLTSSFLGYTLYFNIVNKDNKSLKSLPIILCLLLLSLLIVYIQFYWIPNYRKLGW